MEDSGLPTFMTVIAAAAMVIGVMVAIAAVTWIFMLR